MMFEELLRGLTQEQIDKVRRCKNPDEILRLAKSEGVTLTEEQLKAVNGGACENSTNKNTHKKLIED